ncbi:BQ2448_3256 [Microbotryum intermedium]|uniref:BQ2448_3256 protein n=1 Tax=Microbotryum intermedium TaxID=269621 RepID=A0A238FKH0_9BASI|nr:BQ2448_3256 [Microbotryum intermedium]
MRRKTLGQAQALVCVFIDEPSEFLEQFVLRWWGWLDIEAPFVVPRITVWTSCKATEPSLLSTASYAFSFAKWTELSLYDPNCVPLPDFKYSHATDERGALVRSFAIDRRTVVKMVRDQIE